MEDKFGQQLSQITQVRVLEAAWEKLERQKCTVRMACKFNTGRTFFSLGFSRDIDWQFRGTNRPQLQLNPTFTVFYGLYARINRNARFLLKKHHRERRERDTPDRDRDIRSRLFFLGRNGVARLETLSVKLKIRGQTKCEKKTAMRARTVSYEKF